MVKEKSSRTRNPRDQRPKPKTVQQIPCPPSTETHNNQFPNQAKNFYAAVVAQSAVSGNTKPTIPIGNNILLIIQKILPSVKNCNDLNTKKSCYWLDYGHYKRIYFLPWVKFELCSGTTTVSWTNFVTFINHHNIQIVLQELHLNHKNILRLPNVYIYIYLTERPLKSGISTHGKIVILVHHITLSLLTYEGII